MEGGDSSDPYDQYEKRKNKWYLDVQHTPCARSGLLYGILGGIAVGGLRFAQTGIVRRSCDFAIGGFAIIALVTWEVCRYQKAKLRADLKKTIHILDNFNNKEQGSTHSPDNSHSDSPQ